MSRCLILTALVLCAAVQVPAGPGIPDAELRPLFGLPDHDVPAALPVATVGERLGTVEAAHMGSGRILLALVFRDPLHINSFDGGHLQLYLDLDDNPATGRADPHAGVDLQILIDAWGLVGQGHRPVPRVSIANPAYRDRTEVRAQIQGRRLFILVDAPPAALDGDVPLRLYLEKRFPDGHTEQVPRDMSLRLPRHDLPLSAIPPRQTFSALRPSDYRVLDPIPQEALHHKGISRAAVSPYVDFEAGRAPPALVLDPAGRRPSARGAVDEREVPVRILEESGVGREGAPVTFGFPFPRGALFNPARVVVQTAAGRVMAAQRTATAYWPDDSVKWVRIDFTAAFPAGEERGYVVRFGNRVEPPDAGASEDRIVFEESADSLIVSTGPLRAELRRGTFNGVTHAWRVDEGAFDPERPVASAGDTGIFLRDERGVTYGTAALPPDRFVVEEQGPFRAVVRVEGAYGSAAGEPFMRYITRLVFRAGSPVVGIEHSHINDRLDFEFTDFTELSMPIRVGGGVRSAMTEYTDAAGARHRLEGTALSLFQWTDEEGEGHVSGQTVRGTRSPGLLRIEGEHGAMGVAMQDFWQRWPKGWRVEADAVYVDLLPALPDPDFGRDLPYYLNYPFVAGHYRLKWGMSFTERLDIDFGGDWTADRLRAEAEKRLVAVIPAAWYAETEALGVLPVPRGREFAAWDAYFEEAFDRHMERQRRQREYGFLNYGDYQGERGRNWANNEYDSAHAFFMQFVRTGRRDYFREALAAARHQADVDMMHAHPDPYFVGSNKCHSIGHTGNPHSPLGGWSFNAGWRFSAANGHTWSEGLLGAWHLAGDARCMEMAIRMGEHIAWAVVPSHTGGDRSSAWMLRALMAIYRGTSDPLYLETARTLTREYLRVKDGDSIFVPEPGIVLRRDGQTNWQIGVGLAALKQIHKETNDPEIAEALDRGVRFFAGTWLGGGWPARIVEGGAPLPGASSDARGVFNAEAIAYWAAQTGNDEWLRIAREAVLGQVYMHNKVQARGQRLTMALRSGAAALGWIQRGLDRQAGGGPRPDVLTGDRAELDAYLEALPGVRRFGLAGEDRTVFHLRLNGDSGRVRLERRPHGGRGDGVLRLLDAEGGVIRETGFPASVAEVQHFAVDLSGAAGDRFRVEIEEGQSPGAWDAEADGAALVADVRDGARVRDLGLQRPFFFVPDDCEEFFIDLGIRYTGAYGAALLDGSGRVVEILQSENAWQPGQSPSPDDRRIAARPVPGERGRAWSVVVWARNMEYTLQLDERLPPFLARTAEDWFDPR